MLFVCVFLLFSSLNYSFSMMITRIETARVNICGKEEEIEKYELKNGAMSVEIITYGSTITSIKVPKGDQRDDIVLGFDTIEEYVNCNKPYFGAAIGRVANRIENGIIKVNGKVYQVSQNRAPNTLHGGFQGFDKKIWKAEVLNGTLKMFYLSKDGEEGFPGDLEVTVEYKLNEKNELEIKYYAKSSKPTPVNITNHSYFNLAGQGTGAKEVYNHDVVINADNFTRTNDQQIPTGEIASVRGTPMDLTKEKNLGVAINETPTRGFDSNYCLNGKGYRLAATVSHKKSGRILQVFTNQPGVQFYTGNNLDNLKGKANTTYNKHSAFCLETQNYPNAVNIDSFPNSILSPSDIYKHEVTYKFINI